MQHILHLLLLLALSSSTTREPSSQMNVNHESGTQQLSLNPHEPSSHLIIHIHSLKGTSGQVCVAIFTSEASFRKELALKEKHIPRGVGDSDTLILEILLPAGEYGVSVLDDSDGDGQMRYGFAGIPLEGYGFSNYQHKDLRRPRFSDFSFQHMPPQTSKVEIKMQYFR